MFSPKDTDQPQELEQTNKRKSRWMEITSTERAATPIVRRDQQGIRLADSIFLTNRAALPQATFCGLPTMDHNPNCLARNSLRS